jgi:hypothetical protein
MRARFALYCCMGAALAVPNAYAQQTTIGVLTCTSVAGSQGKGTADSLNQMTCGFRPTGGGAEQYYSGAFKLAPSAGASAGKLVWVWSVFGPETKLPIGGLAQKYIADPPPARGVTIILAGKSNKTISLQPETASDAAPVEVELKLMATPA